MSTAQAALFLSSPWVFWKDKWETVTPEETLQSIVDVGEATNARNFFQLFEANDAMAIPINCSQHVFKKNVKPEWEDEHNAAGGHFRFVPVASATTSDVKKLWYTLLVAVVGDHLTLNSAICGVGFTNKGSYCVASVWIDRTDANAVRCVRKELEDRITGIVELTTAFVVHENLPQGTHRKEEFCQHRRTKSAPSSGGTTISTDMDDQATTSLPVVKKGRNAPSPLDTDIIPSRSHEVDAAHARSKTDGQAHDVVPNVPHVGKATPPPNTDLNCSESTVLSADGSGVYPGPDVKAPTPMKVWADNWSPSLLAVAAQRAAGGGFSAGAVPALGESANTPPCVPQVQADGPTTRPAAAEFFPAGYTASGKPAAAFTMTPPQQAVAPDANAAAKEAARTAQSKSDAPAFVHNGWRYPSGLNRKERRRIMFSGDINPESYSGAEFVGLDVPDGNVEDEEEVVPAQ
jgi:hypothetical protein